jgi:ATPase subunit of ABC transporter with duplicated ATPase domains
LRCVILLLRTQRHRHNFALSGIIWLENFLQQWPKTIILVSHDRNFLNTVCDRIMLIFGGKMEVYKGNYDTFESARTERMKQLRRNALLPHPHVTRLRALPPLAFLTGSRHD